MTLETALRLTEILLGFALLQQSLEHLSRPGDRWLFSLRAILCGLLMLGIAVPFVLGALCIMALLLLHRWQGPYNGGADRMGLLILFCLTIARLWSAQAELAVAYLAAQLSLSYVISGWVKIVNPAWRRGEALCDVFRFSAYPVSENLRAMTDRRQLLFWGSWAVMLFELGFLLAFASQSLLIAALGVAAIFHLSNACFFGLNRFFWTWIAAYPSILWLQARLIG